MTMWTEACHCLLGKLMGIYAHAESKRYIVLALNNSSMHGDGELIVQLRWRHRVHVNRFYISIAKMYSHACTFSRK